MTELLRLQETIVSESVRRRVRREAGLRRDAIVERLAQILLNPTNDRSRFDATLLMLRSPSSGEVRKGRASTTDAAARCEKRSPRRGPHWPGAEHGPAWLPQQRGHHGSTQARQIDSHFARAAVRWPDYRRIDCGGLAARRWGACCPPR